jgi:hypothetical protein
LVQITMANHRPRFWFSEWMVDDHGLSFRQVQVVDRVSPITPPLRVTFNESEPNTTPQIFNGPIDGADAFYDGIVVEKKILTLADNSTEWMIRIKARGNRTHSVGADVTMRLGAARILQYFGSCYGVFFVLKDSLVQGVEAALAQPLPAPPPGHPHPTAPPKPPQPGHGGGAHGDTFGDYYDRLRKRRWDTTIYFAELDRYNTWAKENHKPLRPDGSFETKARADFKDATEKLVAAGHLPREALDHLPKPVTAD